MGLQEAYADQSEAVRATLGPRYRVVGTGRDADGGGEGCPIAFDADRLMLTAWRQLALSTTPDVRGSRSWGARVPRAVVVAELVDAATGRGIVALNTHLDHLSPYSRWRSARLVASLARAHQAADPSALVVVTGDVNAGERSRVHRTLAADGVLRDAWHDAPARVTPSWGTFSNYREPRVGGRRIDLVLVGPTVEVRAVGINAARFGGAAPSDHEPVQVLIRAL